ncbi:DUF3108 domain-containing protein [bacterium]|nr:DUF3108 domain-containing protein [bacterium]MBU1983732.1 DUF3108 domain-containing protein [bacterium]
MTKTSRATNFPLRRIFAISLPAALGIVGWLFLAVGGDRVAASDASDPNTDSVRIVEPIPPPDTTAPPRPLFLPWAGERIDYYIALGIIPAGKARLEILDTTSINGHLTFHARSTARSAKGYDLIFKVRDTVETWFDADSIYAVRFRKRLQEGPYRDEKYVEFDLADSLVRWWDDGERKPDIFVEPRVQDVLSAGFFARTLPLAVGDTFGIRTHDVNKTYDLMVIVHARETVATLAGTFDSFKVEPVLRSGGLFKKEKGARVFVWVTADDRHLLVKMESRVSFGIITAEMESYQPPRAFQ